MEAKKTLKTAIFFQGITKHANGETSLLHWLISDVVTCHMLLSLTGTVYMDVMTTDRMQLWYILYWETSAIHARNYGHFLVIIWVRPRRCGCLVTWFCYQLIAKPGNKTTTPLRPDPYSGAIWTRQFCSYPSEFFHWHCSNHTMITVPVKQPWRIWKIKSHKGRGDLSNITVIRQHSCGVYAFHNYKHKHHIITDIFTDHRPILIVLGS